MDNKQKLKDLYIKSTKKTWEYYQKYLEQIEENKNLLKQLEETTKTNEILYKRNCFLTYLNNKK